MGIGWGVNRVEERELVLGGPGRNAVAMTVRVAELPHMMPRVEVACDDTLAGYRPCKQNFKGNVNMRLPIDVHHGYAVDRKPKDVSRESRPLLIG